MPEFRDLSDLFAQLGRDIATNTAGDSALAVITAAAVHAVEGADASAVTLVRNGKFETIASTGDLPGQVDAIQYELGSGPSVDAVLEQTIFHSNDLRSELRWPDFADRAVVETGVLSMLAFRMFFEERDLLAGLNIYSVKPEAFDDLAETTGLILATHGALALAGTTRLRRIEHLERALASNRDIGVAMGILMIRHLATKQQAFDMLRVASQHSHRKLGLVALEVIDTGQLSYPGARHAEARSEPT
ncbi:ANTAR domain-containing protein [Jatrophihabitans sp. DSM 45814]